MTSLQFTSLPPPPPPYWCGNHHHRRFPENIWITYRHTLCQTIVFFSLKSLFCHLKSKIVSHVNRGEGGWGARCTSGVNEMYVLIISNQYHKRETSDGIYFFFTFESLTTCRSVYITCQFSSEFILFSFAVVCLLFFPTKS